MRTYFPILVAALALTACSNQDDNSTSSVESPVPAAVDAEPTADTGTGGDIPTADPDATLNSAPGQPRPVQ